MNVTLEPKIRWRWIPFGYCAEAIISLSIAPDKLRGIIDDCINRLLPTETFYKQELTDIKGRDPSMVLDPSNTSYLPIKKPELLYISGVICGEKDKGEDTQAEDFSVAIYTDFKEFLGPHHIVHTFYTEKLGAYPGNTKLKELVLLNNVEFKYLRFGYELFESRFAGIFGYTPTIVKTLLVECTETQLNIRAVLEGVRPKEKIYAKFDDFVKTIREIIS